MGCSAHPTALASWLLDSIILAVFGIAVHTRTGRPASSTWVTDLRHRQKRYVPRWQKRYVPKWQKRYVPQRQKRYVPERQNRYVPERQKRYTTSKSFSDRCLSSSNGFTCPWGIQVARHRGLRSTPIKRKKISRDG
ncbi:hypothetical protein N657DRAFT_243306 [Parathielavia appendiculata]|uniref:Uncharacterized protein n=1 Tax=Parathielavia appendiculata TaxID=2587402 RepID=A0AAN6TTS3_9PEZI|nr:hypothetical protein N657DRAFT_243306 [Parathielavia appendiculata]